MMQLIADGKLYDTDTATLIATVYPRDPIAAAFTDHFPGCVIISSLYVTDKNTHFLVERHWSNNWKEKLTPLSKGDARIWAEKHLGVDTVMKFFSVEVA